MQFVKRVHGVTLEPVISQTAVSNFLVQGPCECASPRRASVTARTSRLVISAQLSGMLVDKVRSYGEGAVAAASAWSVMPILRR
jgi:hypothetical protein